MWIPYPSQDQASPWFHAITKHWFWNSFPLPESQARRHPSWYTSGCSDLKDDFLSGNFTYYIFQNHLSSNLKKPEEPTWSYLDPSFRVWFSSLGCLLRDTTRRSPKDKSILYRIVVPTKFILLHRGIAIRNYRKPHWTICRLCWEHVRY